MSIENFLNESYQRHNRRRQEHLASLGLPISGKRVIELGAGIGDHTSFFLDRGCTVTVTDARRENVDYARTRFPNVDVRVLDIEGELPTDLEQYDVVYAYGLLYHLSNPASALVRMASIASEMLLLETCVSFGEGEHIHSTREEIRDPTQAAHGLGCRPTRSWIFNALGRQFEHVYLTRTQPWHEEFPVLWNCQPPVNDTGLFRSVFVASRRALPSSRLIDHLVDVQSRE
jgi:SAM-dependent methyltransferase